MKNAAKKWYNYLYSLAGLIVLMAGALVPYFVTNGSEWPLKYVCYFMLFGGVVYLLVGFIAQDLFRGWSRHKLKDWDNPLPQNVIDKAWSIYFPIFTSGLLSVATGLITYLIIK